MLTIFKKVAYLEGISYIALLFVAMPLKYIFHMPLAVRITGTAHGGLFVLYVLVALLAWNKENWSFKTLALAMVASVLPFGPFIFDHKFLGEDSSTL